MVTIILLCIIIAILAVFAITVGSTVVLASKILIIAVPVMIVLWFTKKLFFSGDKSKPKKKED